MNLLGKANPEIQQKRWQEIVEKYYREVDESSFEVFLKDTKKDIAWKCDYIQMISGLNLAEIGLEQGWNILENVGIKAKDIKQARQKINAKITNHELKQKKDNTDESEPKDFYEMWASVRKVGYNIDEDIRLVSWIGVLKNIKKENERQNIKK